MTVGLVKLIAERDYGADDVKPDVRVFHCEEKDAEAIERFYRNAGWEIHREEV